MSKLGEKIKNMRLLRGIGVEELAEKAGVSQASISKLENGLTVKPQGGTIVNIAKVLGVNAEYFLDDSLITPFELIENMSPELKNFLLNEDSMPYIEMAIKAWKDKVKAEDINEVIKFFGKFSKK